LFAESKSQLTQNAEGTILEDFPQFIVAAVRRGKTRFALLLLFVMFSVNMIQKLTWALKRGANKANSECVDYSR